jgi:hypothetical protein
MSHGCYPLLCVVTTLVQAVWTQRRHCSSIVWCHRACATAQTQRKHCSTIAGHAHVCCRHYLAVDLHVTICIKFLRCPNDKMCHITYFLILICIACPMHSMCCTLHCLSQLLFWHFIYLTVLPVSHATRIYYQMEGWFMNNDLGRI